MFGTEASKRSTGEESGRIQKGRAPIHGAPQAELETAVVGALVQSGYVALANVGCKVSGERVILFGAVPTYHLKQLAQVFAQRVDGVRFIQNRISVFA